MERTNGNVTAIHRFFIALFGDGNEVYPFQYPAIRTQIPQSDHS